MDLEVKEDEVPREDLYKSFRGKKQLSYLEVLMPARTILSFDRIYIRKGVEAYDSVTFRIHKKKGNCPNENFLGTRFWAKLNDVNNIVCEVIA